MAGKRKKIKKAKNFVAVPQYPGGQKALSKFIQENLRYPGLALHHRIEGDVHVSFQVSNEGKTEEVTVLNGIGYKCDEEAIRIIQQLHYEPARNRGMKVRSKIKTMVRFRLPPQNETTFRYITPTVSSDEPQKQPATIHHYTLTIDTGEKQH